MKDINAVGEKMTRNGRKIAMSLFCWMSLYNSRKKKLGSVAGPVIQANGRLSFEDGLRSGGLLYCVSQ